MHTPAIARFTTLSVPPVSFDAAPFFEKASISQLQAILTEMDAGEYGWHSHAVVRYLVDEPGYDALSFQWEIGLANDESLVCEYRRDHVEAWLSRKIAAKASGAGPGDGHPRSLRKPTSSVGAGRFHDGRI